MTIRPVDVGGVTVPNNIFCAPLAGYTDFAFRKLCYFYGAGLCFTEMVSAKGLKYNSEATRALLKKDASEKITAVQIFGSDPAVRSSGAHPSPTMVIMSFSPSENSEFLARKAPKQHAQRDIHRRHDREGHEHVHRAQRVRDRRRNGGKACEPRKFEHRAREIFLIPNTI